MKEFFKGFVNISICGISYNLTTCIMQQLLPRDSYAKRGICRRRVSVCVSVCLSHSSIVSKRLNVGLRK